MYTVYIHMTNRQQSSEQRIVLVVVRRDDDTGVSHNQTPLVVALYFHSHLWYHYELYREVDNSQATSSRVHTNKFIELHKF